MRTHTRLDDTPGMEMHTAQLVHATPEAEELIVYMARVSNPQNQNNKNTSAKLLRYLIKHHHWSPFEMASMCVELNTTRAIAAQILRHRSFSFQEFSQRYSNVGDLPVASPPQLRTADPTNKQASHDNLDPELAQRLEGYISRSFNDSFELYQELIANDVAKECARSVLPLATPTRLYMHGTLRSWIHYLQIRTGVETQLEHREIALDIDSIFAEQFPIISEAAFPA